MERRADNMSLDILLTYAGVCWRMLTYLTYADVAVMERRADNMSLDILSRVLVDVQMDSNRIMDDLVSGYQRALLHVIYMGDTQSRTKFNCIFAEGITPRMSAKTFMAKGECEKEVKQVLGDIFLAEDIGHDDMIVVGRQGLLLAGTKVLAYWCKSTITDASEAAQVPTCHTSSPSPSTTSRS